MKTKESDSKSQLVINTPLNLAVKYLTIRARGEQELHNYLLKKEFKEEEILETIEKLKKLNFLDDKSFIKSFVEQRQRKGKSRRVIEFELKTKGIEKEESKKILGESVSDLKTAYEYIQKRIHQFDRFDKLTKRKKIITRLHSRGFNWETIKRVIKKIEP